MKRCALFAVIVLSICGCGKDDAFMDNGTPADIARLIAREQTFDKLLPVKVGGKYGFIDRAGKMVVNPQFDEASRFQAELSRVCLGRCDYSSKKDESKYGYIDESGRIVISPQFDRAESFFEGLAAICVGGCGYDDAESHKWGFINKQGTIVIQPQFGKTLFFHDGLGAVCVGPCSGYGDTFEGKWGYIDQTGKFVINPQFEDAEYFRGGVARVTIGKGNQKKQGYVTDKGTFVWPPSN
jgi:hypothetical protein